MKKIDYTLLADTPSERLRGGAIIEPRVVSNFQTGRHRHRRPPAEQSCRGRARTSRRRVELRTLTPVWQRTDEQSRGRSSDFACRVFSNLSLNLKPKHLRVLRSHVDRAPSGQAVCKYYSPRLPLTRKNRSHTAANPRNAERRGGLHACTRRPCVACCCRPAPGLSRDFLSQSEKQQAPAPTVKQSHRLSAKKNRVVIKIMLSNFC